MQSCKELCENWQIQVSLFTLPQKEKRGIPQESMKHKVTKNIFCPIRFYSAFTEVAG